MAPPIKPLPMRGTVDPAEAKKAQEQLYGNIADVASNLPYGGVVADALGFTKAPSAPSAPAVVTQPTYRASGSPEQDIQSGLTTNWSEPVKSKVPGNVTVDTATQDAPAGPTEKEKQEKQLADLRAQIMGMGAPSVGMNKYIKRGFEGQQEALGDQIAAIRAGEPETEAARAGMQQVGQQYIGGLEKLGAQRQQLFDARRGAMAEEERRLAGEEKSFDASRVVREIGKNPVGTAALSFAAGLVGALKGAAGDMSTNQILGEVDKAVERDVRNQQEQYSRMLNGMSAARTNFLDARQMGADENAALAASTLASMDQHKRALEFAEKRVAGNRDKAALKGAMYALDGQRGKIQMDLDLKNAAAAGAMNRAKVEALLKLQAGTNQLPLDDQIKLGNAYHSATNNDDWKSSSTQLQAVAEMRKLQGKIPLSKQRALWDTSIGKVIREASSRAASEKDAGLATKAAAQYISAQMKSDMSQEERDMLALAQELVNNRLRDISGGSVTDGEGVRDVMSRDLTTFEGFNNWMTRNEGKAMAGINRGLAVGQLNPMVAKVMESTVAPWIQANTQYARTIGDTAELESNAAGGAAK